MSTAAVADASAPPKRRNKKLIVIAAAAVLVLGLGGAGGYLMLKKSPAAEESAEDGDDSTAAHTPAHAAVKRDASRAPTYVPLDPFTVNLADREVERYAQVGITLELVDAKTSDQIKNFMPAIRNNILMVLAHKQASELLEREGKIRLAGEVQRAASRALGVDVPEPQAASAIDKEPAKKKKAKLPDVVLPISAVHFSNLIVQ